MNEERIHQCIAMMKGAKNLNMCYFQQGERIAKSTRQLHACGNTACFAGYLAIAPFFKAAGGDQLPNSGIPLFNNRSGVCAVAEFLDISSDLADKLVFGNNLFYYPVDFEHVKPEHVIAKLQMILDGELK